MKHIYLPGSFKTADGIGTVALCGHVKDTPWSGEVWTGETGPDRCSECIDHVSKAGAA